MRGIPQIRKKHSVSSISIDERRYNVVTEGTRDKRFVPSAKPQGNDIEHGIIDQLSVHMACNRY
jgi:hypothetical protein